MRPRIGMLFISMAVASNARARADEFVIAIFLVAVCNCFSFVPLDIHYISHFFGI